VETDDPRPGRRARARATAILGRHEHRLLRALSHAGNAPVDPARAHPLQGLEALATLEPARGHIARARKRFKLGAGIAWAIVTRTDGALAGTCTYAHFVPLLDRGHITYQLARHAWGQGLGTEAVRAMVAFGHGVAGLNRIEAVVVPENEASVRVLRKAGFEDEGLLRGYGRWRGRYHDLRMFGIVREG
jgi:ribosomal-protein-alanine N-acetyltransferase